MSRIFIMVNQVDHHRFTSSESLYCIDFLGRKINLSRISSAKRSRSGRNSLYIDSSSADNVHGILGAMGKMGSGTSPAEPEFFCLVIHATFRQLRNDRFSPNLAAKRSSVFCRWIQKHIFKNFHFRGHSPPKYEIENRSKRHLTQSTLQVTGCREILFTPRCSPRAREFRGRSTFLYDVRLRSYGVSMLPSFRILVYFPYTKPVKLGDQPTA